MLEGRRFHRNRQKPQGEGTAAAAVQAVARSSKPLEFV